MTRTRDEAPRDALAHLTTTERYATRDLDDQLVIDAICMRLSAGIETLATLHTADRDDPFGDSSPLMWGMRNRIAHGYLLVDSAIIRQTPARRHPGHPQPDPSEARRIRRTAPDEK